ncbi:TetR/AcrR family transcriptional regulator [Arthrobacter bambusae]|uniref:AcrR family transcriptional regulator n=1 Tax=Arthrobacter bambusae TaxID=1338426 RepID=A0AAW8DH59_9MICC|nr:TetR/AcrR family transcriptional regulator [Arthrobacter bambusae]MDP9904584.1 AcrR family transcriptional regulator [Arthrobacter bambusae]MDQ0129400.1 AcrR family transcriptional regulator [Arthrobacter bambusae]MDQ0180987.1 AcrR family transcriptional regulator [Arthrobacter bambusae]
MPEDELSPRAHRSRVALLEAAVTILESDDRAPEITITDIVALAGVSRPTFYKNFDNIPALVREAALRRLTVAFDAIPDAALGENWPDFARGVFHGVLTELVCHSRFYLGALDLAETPISNDFVTFLSEHLLDRSPIGPVIRRRRGKDTPQQRADFLAAGTVWHVRAWLRSPRATEDAIDAFVDEIAALLLSASGATDDEIARAGLGG